MYIKKVVQCNRCKGIVEQNGKCLCGSVIMVEGEVQNGYSGNDYIDISPKLLNEVV